MREKDVPQDPSYYQDLERVCFALDEDDHYVPARSRGWEVERLATEQALLVLEEQVERERRRVLAGEVSSLAYHLAARQMTPKLFAQHVGLAAWRVRRHLKPRVFARLGPERLAHYARCLDLAPAELARVPTEARRVFFEEGRSTSNDRRTRG